MKSFQKILLVMQLGMAGLIYGECVIDGMNLWQLAECIACSVGAQFEVTQANFAAGINASGHYKLCENITGGIIDINTSDVILDLGGYTTTAVTISVPTGVSNLVIRNGTMGEAVAVPIIIEGSGHQNIVIEDIIINTIEPLAGDGGAITTTGAFTGLLIRNITIYSGGVNAIIVTNDFGSSKDVFIENVRCINTVSGVAAPANPNAVIYLQDCDNVVLKDIALIDQYQELNGVWLDTCTNIQADGVSVTSTLATPVGTPFGYQTSTCTAALHKNITVDGGANFVYQKGIFDSGSTQMIFDSCSVESAAVTCITPGVGNMVLNSIAVHGAGNGFEIGNDVYVENCVANFVEVSGFVIDGNSAVIKNCTASNNSAGFNVTGNNVSCIGSIATINDGVGFFISGDGCSFDSCEANNNVSNGFSIIGTNIVAGCYVTNSIANDNGGYGVYITGIGAETTVTGGFPANKHWNIGQFSPTIGTTNNHNVRLVNNIALRNQGVMTVAGTPNGFVMAGTVYSNDPTGTSQTFTSTQIFPPIGVLNTVQGIIYDDIKPLPNTSLGGTTGLTSTATGYVLYGNTVGGNITGNSPIALPFP